MQTISVSPFQSNSTTSIPNTTNGVIPHNRKNFISSCNPYTRKGWDTEP